MNQTAILSLQVLCHLNCLRTPNSNDANIVVLNPPAISNQSPSPVQPTTLPEGYIAYPEIDAAYKIIFQEATWSEAREQCNLEGAHLAILDSQRKMDHVRNTTYHTYHRTSTYLEIYTGIYRMDQKWVDSSTGKTLSDLPWYQNYPSSSPNDCAIVELLQSGECRLHNSSGCGTKYFYICEVPIPKDYTTQENRMAQIPVN